MEAETVSRSEFEAVLARLSALEEKVAAAEASDQNAEQSAESQEQKKQGPEFDIIEESSLFVTTIIDTAINAMSEAANKVSRAAEEAKAKHGDDLPEGIINVMRKAVDIQKKAINRFEDRFNKEKPQEEAPETEVEEDKEKP